MPRNHDGEGIAGATRSERILVFRLDQELHAIRVAEISGVVSCDSLRDVPGAPVGVLGLAEWRGTVLTVLDLPLLLGRDAPRAPACLIRLADPLDQTALHLPATIRLADARLDSSSPEELGAEEPGWLCGEESVHLVDSVEIVRRVESELRVRA